MNGDEISRDHNGLFVLAEESHAGPGHYYTIGSDHNPLLAVVRFQAGPVGEHGVNGITNEALLEVLIDRTGHLDELRPCPENKEAIIRLRQALAAFHQRTDRRQALGIEGTDAECPS